MKKDFFKDYLVNYCVNLKLQIIQSTMYNIRAWTVWEYTAEKLEILPSIKLKRCKKLITMQPNRIHLTAEQVARNDRLSFSVGLGITQNMLDIRGKSA